MAQGWAEKAKALTIKTRMTPREIYEVTGNCIRACCVREIPLFTFYESIEVVRRIAGLIHVELDWDTPLLLKKDELEALSRWRSFVSINEWQFLPIKQTPMNEIWTDASNLMWAYTDLGEKAAQDFFSVDQIQWHIFLKGAYAVHRSMEVTRGIPRLYRVENMPLVLAMKRRVSSNKLVNSWMRTWDWNNISVEWVSTEEQRADEYTRGKVMPTPKGPTTRSF